MTIKINTILYHANWCGHCQHFLPEWMKLEEKIKNMDGKYNNIEISAKNIEEKDLKGPATINGAGIKGYPTVKIVVKDENKKKVEYEYDGKRDINDLFSHIVNDAPKNI